MRAVVLVMVGSLLAPIAGAHAVECYGNDSPELVEVGDYRTYRDQNNILTTSVVKSESYDTILRVQSITTESVGGLTDGYQHFFRNSFHQSLLDGFDRYTSARIRTLYIPPVPTSYPICPGSMQSFDGEVSVIAWLDQSCTGSYQTSSIATHWESVTVPAGTFRALRVETEFHTTYDHICALGPASRSSVAWLAPGAGTVRIESGSTVSVLVDAKPEPVPEPEASALSCTALASLVMLRKWNARSS